MGSPQIIFGTCDGTGAAINVCLGFIPRYVKVLNTEDGGSLYGALEWFKNQAVISAMDEGLLLLGTTDADRSVIATGGISAYNGGDKIKYDANTSGRWELTTGTAFPGGNSAEEVYVDGSYERTASGDAAYKCIGDTLCPELYHGQECVTPKGFTIGTDGNMNVDGEQLVWMAIR